jgi:hypothetical protein
MSNNELEWEKIVAKIREWDRREHNWAVTNKTVDTKNLQTKERFIRSLMVIFELKKKDNN